MSQGAQPGVATQSPWLQRGLDPASKSVRVASYLATLRFELESLGRTCGHPHPGLVTADQVELLDVDLESVRLDELFDYEPGWGLPSRADRAAIADIMTVGPR